MNNKIVVVFLYLSRVYSRRDDHLRLSTSMFEAKAFSKHSSRLFGPFQGYYIGQIPHSNGLVGRQVYYTNRIDL